MKYCQTKLSFISLLFISLTLLILSAASYAQDRSGIEIKSITFEYSTLKGLEPESGICRRDPSDVILVDGKYYVWYTKTEKR